MVEDGAALAEVVVAGEALEPIEVAIGVEDEGEVGRRGAHEGVDEVLVRLASRELRSSRWWVWSVVMRRKRELM